MGSDDSEMDEHDRVLAPDDLDITEQPEVEEIDDGRYVVSPSGPAEKPDRELLENPDWLNNDDEPDETPEQPSRQSPQRDRTQSGEPAGNQRSGRQSSPAAKDSRQPSEQSPSADASQSRSRSQSSTDHPTQGSQQPQGASQPRSSEQSQGANQPQQPQRSRQQESRHAQETAQPEQSTPSKADQSPARSEPTQASQPAGERADKPQSRELAAHDQPPAEPPAAELTNENVSKFLAKSLAQKSGDYGFDATVNIEGSVNRGRMTSDDIGETLETLLRWYAKQTTDEVDPEHVLGIILAGSDLAVEYPVQSAYEVVKQHGLGPDDSIGDLLAAVREDGSFTVPPSKE